MTILPRPGAEVLLIVLKRVSLLTRAPLKLKYEKCMQTRVMK